MGWDVPRPKAGPPELPDDLGTLSDAALMTAFNAHTQWANYLESQMTNADVEEEEAEANLNLSESQFLIQATQVGGKKITDARLERDADEAIGELRHTLRLARAKRKRLGTHLRIAERTAAMLSRELTRRTSLGRYEGRGGA